MTTPFPPDPDAPSPVPDPDAPPPVPDPDAPFPPDPEAPPPPVPDPDVPRPGPDPDVPPVPNPDVPPPAPERTRFADPAAPPAPAPAITTSPPVIHGTGQGDVGAPDALAGSVDQRVVREEPEPLAAAPASSRAPVTALAAVVVVLAILTAFLGWRAVDTAGKGPVEKSRTEALAAARTAAVLVFSYDYRHLDKDFKAGLAVTTGEFRGDYQKTTGKLVSDVAPRYHAVVTAAVSEAAVVDASKNRVLTLVFVNQQSTSTLTKQPKITTSRLEMTMVRRDNRWLVSKIKAL